MRRDVQSTEKCNFRARTNFAKQRSYEWHEQRKNKLTASKFAQAAGYSKSSRAELWRILSGLKTESVWQQRLDWMEEGKRLEQLLSFEYEIAMDVDVYEEGFITHPDIEWMGCSPDGIVIDGNKAGIVEYKVAVYAPYAEIPIHHVPQIQGCAEIVNAWLLKEQGIGVDFIDYVEGDYDENSKLKTMMVRRFPRDKNYFDRLFPMLHTFWQYYLEKKQPPNFSRQNPKPQPLPYLPEIFEREFIY